MSTTTHVWSELEKVSRFSWRKKNLPKEIRIAKAEKNVQRRNERIKS